MDKIIDHLFIGNIQSTTNKELLEKNKIDIIINCTNTKTDAHFQIPLNDPPNRADIEFLNNNYTTIVSFIEHCIQQNKNILFHCIAGSQRSPTIVAIYLMYEYEMSYQQACKTIKSRRPISFFGSVNFIESLKYIQTKLAASQ